MAAPKALVLTSTSSRHRYFISEIAKAFDVVGVMTEPKRNYFDSVRQSPLGERHFKMLAETEKEFFPAVPANIEMEIIPDLNTPEAVARAKALGPDVVCLFGTSILKSPWLEAFPTRIVNLHLGLSPFYRGSATLFWPFYFQELEYLGSTIHLAVEKVDAGAILKRIKASLLPGDSYYTATTRLIRDSIDAFPSMVREYLEGKRRPQAQESISGHVMKKSDFTEAALQAALDFVGGGLTPEQIARAAQETPCPCLP